MQPKTETPVILFCAPQSQYPSQPVDVSKCRLVDCTSCNKPMWLSEKKELMKELADAKGKEVILVCYFCFKEWALKNPDALKDHVRVDL